MRLRRWLALLVAGTLVPVLAFSLAALYRYGRQIERLLGAGARAFLTKPIDVRRLLAVLDEHMGTGPRHSAG